MHKLSVLRVGIACLTITSGAAVAQGSDNRIALIPGGPHPYFAPWEEAAKDAMTDFGIADVQFKVPSDFKLNLQTELMESLTSQGFNGFAIFPGDAVGVNSTIEELQFAEVPVITLAGCAAEPTEAVVCFAPDIYVTTVDATNRLIESMGGKGRVVHLAGMLVDPNTKVRMKAVEDAVAAAGPDVTLLQTVGDTDNQEQGDQLINALLGAQSANIDGLVATGYVQSAVAAKALRNLGDKRIKLIGTNDDRVLLDAIRDGYATGAMVLNAYAEGYVGAYIVDMLASGCTFAETAPITQVSYSDTLIANPSVFVDASNVDTYMAESKQAARGVQAQIAEQMVCGE